MSNYRELHSENRETLKRIEQILAKTTTNLDQSIVVSDKSYKIEHSNHNLNHSYNQKSTLISEDRDQNGNNYTFDKSKFQQFENSPSNTPVVKKQSTTHSMIRDSHNQSINEPKFKSTIRQLTYMVEESYHDILKVNTTLSKSDNNDIFSTIKIIQAIKQNLVDCQQYLHGLDANVDKYVKEEVSSSKIEVTKNQTVKMNKIEAKVNELIRINEDLKAKNARYYEIANRASDLLTKHNLEHSQVEDLKQTLKSERDLLNAYEKEKYYLSSENIRLKTMLNDIEAKYNLLEEDYKENYSKLKNDLSAMISVKEEAILKLSLEKQSISEYWLKEFERLKEDRDKQYQEKVDYRDKYLEEYDTLKSEEENYKLGLTNMKDEILDMTRNFEEEKENEFIDLNTKLQVLMKEKSDWEIKYENLNYEYTNFKKEHEHVYTRKNYYKHECKELLKKNDDLQKELHDLDIKYQNAKDIYDNEFNEQLMLKNEAMAELEEIRAKYNEQEGEYQHKFKDLKDKLDQAYIDFKEFKVSTDHSSQNMQFDMQEMLSKSETILAKYEKAKSQLQTIKKTRDGYSLTKLTEVVNKNKAMQGILYQVKKTMLSKGDMKRFNHMLKLQGINIKEQDVKREASSHSFI